MPYTISQIPTTTNSNNDQVPFTRRNTPITIETCSSFVGRPLSREQALAKMERSPQFMEAAQHFSGLPDQARHDDIVQNAVQLDYGIRLRNCLAAGIIYSNNNNSNSSM
jgi:hypothetical protein